MIFLPKEGNEFFCQKKEMKNFRTGCQLNPLATRAQNYLKSANFNFKGDGEFGHTDYCELKGLMG